MSLNIFLDDTAKSNGVSVTESTLISVKFKQLIEQLHEKTFIYNPFLTLTSCCLTVFGLFRYNLTNNA
jgi:hypothetical protein